MELTLIEPQAIKAAMEGTWERAKDLNKRILKAYPNNISALNRLAKAYWETGDIIKATKTYKKVLSSDQYNPIAVKNLERIAREKKSHSKEKPKEEKTQEGSAGIFLEEPGKTKIIKLLRLASPEILAKIDSGDKVDLVPKKRLITINLEDGTYLGSLPEDISWRLISLMKGGNHYEAFILRVSSQELEIFIKEVFRSVKFRNLASF